MLQYIVLSPSGQYSPCWSIGCGMLVLLALEIHLCSEVYTVIFSYLNKLSMNQITEAILTSHIR